MRFHMKACIVVFSSIASTPFMYKYISVFKKNNIKFDIIHWDRYDYNENVEECDSLYQYKKNVPDSSHFILKVVPMISFANFAKKILKKNKYDLVVVLTSLIGVLLENFLTKFYPSKYILDIRDHSYEHIKWYYNKMKRLVENSALNIISSEGFKNFLPDSKYSIMHNCTYNNDSGFIFSKSVKTPLKIFFIGAIRYANEVKRFIDIIADNPSFEFHFYGRGSGEADLLSFCQERKISNVFYNGAYDPKDKDAICQQADFIYNAYGESLHVKYALSNKYYDALYHKKPLIVNQRTSMAEVSGNISYKLDYSQDISIDLVNWYNAVDEKEFDTIANEKLKTVITENHNTESKIQEVINKVHKRY